MLVSTRRLGCISAGHQLFWCVTADLPLITSFGGSSHSGQFTSTTAQLGTSRIRQALDGQATYSSCWVACARSRLIPSTPQGRGRALRGGQGADLDGHVLYLGSLCEAAHAAF